MAAFISWSVRVRRSMVLNCFGAFGQVLPPTRPLCSLSTDTIADASLGVLDMNWAWLYG